MLVFMLMILLLIMIKSMSMSVSMLMISMAWLHSAVFHRHEFHPAFGTVAGFI